MEKANKTRNICVLAHVDHGKTTLADHLIAAAGGGVLHPKQAGKLRYLDYRDDEQQRAITMKSASIALRFRGHLVNLIDSPGHIDFCSEVSTAVRLSDGALVLVDVCEGVRIQTQAVLRQAWAERVKPCLVLNKMDRLITELKLTPQEAYTRLRRIVDEVNSLMSSFCSERYLSDVNGGKDQDEEEFCPRNGNVAFSSAIDGWAFRVDDLLTLWSAKLKNNASELRKNLWTFTSKDKFAQLILQPLWDIYQGKNEFLEKIIAQMKLLVPAREARTPQCVLSRMIPLSDSLLGMVLDMLPNPATAQAYRTSHILPKRLPSARTTPEGAEEIESTRQAVENCDAGPTAPCVTFVSKVFSVPIEIVPSADGSECFLAFARVFSGVLSVGQKVYVLSAIYDPTDTEKQSYEAANVESLYLMMGRGLEPVESAQAGNIVAIRGLRDAVLKSATLCSSPNCWPMTSLSFQAAPILRVAVEPSDPTNYNALSKGLQLLNKADPFVQVTFSSTGEHVISVAGEVHLEVCIKDLRERFARVELQVSPPLVPFRETIDVEVGEPPGKAVVATTPNTRCTLHVQVMKMPGALAEALDETSDTIKGLVTGKKAGVEALRNRLATAAAADPNFDSRVLNRIWSCKGANLLITPETRNTELVQGHAVLSELLGFPVEQRVSHEDTIEANIVSGFQLASSGGPLCKEPLWGVIFIVEATSSGPPPPCQVLEHAGQVITAVKEACRGAVLQRRPRLVEAMYMCEVSTSSAYLGQMYRVLSKRRSKILKEEMREGTDMFTVEAYMPVFESIGFCEELRQRTSGAASPQLRLSHWEVLHEDPFFVPSTQEELEEFGDGSSVPRNTARKLIDDVRRRKGLPVEDKIVRHATKQRTLAKKV